MAEFKFTRRAQLDLAALARYGRLHFGVARAAAYVDALEDCCATLGEHPNPGLRCPGLRGVWRAPCGSHVIFYRLLRRVVRVSRILHESQLAQLHLPTKS